MFFLRLSFLFFYFYHRFLYKKLLNLNNEKLSIILIALIAFAQTARAQFGGGHGDPNNRLRHEEEKEGGLGKPSV